MIYMSLSAAFYSQKSLCYKAPNLSRMVAELVLTFLVTFLSAVLVAVLALRSPTAAPERQRRVQPTDTTERWERLVLGHRRVRKLQRIYHSTGIHLQTFPKSLLQRLSRQHLADERRR